MHPFRQTQSPGRSTFPIRACHAYFPISASANLIKFLSVKIGDPPEIPHTESVLPVCGQINHFCEIILVYLLFFVKKYLEILPLNFLRYLFWHCNCISDNCKQDHSSAKQMPALQLVAEKENHSGKSQKNRHNRTRTIGCQRITRYIFPLYTP